MYLIVWDTSCLQGIPTFDRALKNVTTNFGQNGSVRYVNIIHLLLFLLENFFFKFLYYLLFFLSASETNGSQLSLAHSEKSLSSSRTSLTNNSQKSIKLNDKNIPEPVDNNDKIDLDLGNDIQKNISEQTDNETGNPILNLANDRPNCNERDITSAIVDYKGAILVNQYWGVSLEIPENALPEGIQQELYFVISDPRLCENAPPLDFENGIWLLTFFSFKQY